MSPTPNHHNDPRPDPDESSLHGKSGPGDAHVRLSAGNLRHVRTFEEICQTNGLELLEIDDTTKLTQPFGQVLSNIIAQHPTWLPKIGHPLVLRILRAAENADSYHVLGCLTDPRATRSFFLDVPNCIAPLEPGRSATFVCVVPRALMEGTADPAKEETLQLAFRAQLDIDTFEDNLSALSQGEKNGLFTAVINSRLLQQNRPIEPMLSVERSTTRDDSFCALMVRFPSGSALIEILREQKTGSVNIGDLRFLAPGTRPSQDFFYDERSPDTVRAHLVADLSARELEPMGDVDWVLNAKRMFGEALERLFADPNAASPVFVEIKQLLVRRDGSMISSLVAEAVLQRPDKSFLVPSRQGDEMLRTTEPASLFYSLVPHESPTGERTVAYRLSHLALPPCGGIEGVIEAMMKAPDRSILTEPVIAVLGADLGLEEEDLSSLKLTSVIPLTVDAGDDSIEITARNAHVDRIPVLVLCSHTKGAHLVAISRTGSGLLNVIDDIIPLHFFAPKR